MICEAVPSIEQVRMVSSGHGGDDGRPARCAWLHRPRPCVKFAGCYHGHVDSLLVKAGSGALTHGTPSSPGVPAGCTADTLVLEFNDDEAWKRRSGRRGPKSPA